MTQPFILSDTTNPPASGPQSISTQMRFLCRLGQGGMAEVHLAEHTQPGVAPRLVVVKRMYEHHEQDAATRGMFIDEARLALCLSHPNIVSSERVGVFEGRHGIVMEFLEGQPLHQVLKRAYETDASLSVDVIAQIAIAALDGLHYAHELSDVAGNPLGVVHRDVSPQNLFLTYDGAVKLLDFGIAKNALQDGRTRTGMLKGKVSYMAPEQARGEDLDRRADLWSLGVVLWEAVTGSRLFRGANEAATLNLTLTESIAAPSSRREDVPDELEVILMRALSRKPDDRYPSAAAMRDDLEAWLSTRELAAHASLSHLMQRLFAKEIRDQRHQIRGLLAARLDGTTDSGITLRASQGPISGTFTGQRGTQVSTVTDLMDELTRQKRVTARLFSGLLALAAAAMLVGLVALLSQRAPALATQSKAPVAAAATALAPAVVVAPPAQVPSITPVGTSEPAPRSSSHGVAKSSGAGSKVAPPAGAAHHAPEVSAPLPPAPSMSVPETGQLNLDTTPWSQVTLGGRNLGTTPLVGVTLPAGSPTLVLSNPEQSLKTTYQVTITAGKTTARRVGLD